MDHWSRRQFVQGVGAVGLAGCGRLPWQAGALSPPPRHYRLGYLAVGSNYPSVTGEAFLRRLRDHGYVEGENLTVEVRAAEFDTSRLPALAAELVRLPADVIVTAGSLASVAAARATNSVPIVTVVGDPVRDGLAASYARPGGNVTGVTTLDNTLGAKRLQLLQETVPGASRVAVLWDTTNASKTAEFRETQTAAQVLGLELLSLGVHDHQGFVSAFEAARRDGADALVVLPDVLNFNNRAELAALAVQHKLPMLQEQRESVLAGGLMAYGPSLADNYRRAADYVHRVLTGANPAELPIEQPREFDFVINLQTAQALGLTIPPHVLLQATEVIQ